MLFKCQYTKVENVDMKKLDNIIGFPCLNHNHWAVIIADRKNRIFYYLDPFIAKEGEINLAFKNWKKFMASRPTGDFPKIDSWVIGNFTHDKQSDIVSCGILCLMFLEKIIIHKSKECKFTTENIHVFRQNYFDLLNSHND